MVDINRLRTFRAVVAAGSISSASESLGYTKSAISQQLSTLAKETGLTLFVRTGRGLTLTGPGRTLFEGSDTLIREHATLEALIGELKAGRRQPLVVGTFASAGEALLPPVLADLAAKFPHSPINVVLSDVAPPATRPDIDLRVEVPGREVAPSRGYTRIEIAMEPYLAILPPSHRLKGRKEIRLDELQNEPWIRDDVSDSPCAAIAASAWLSAGITPMTVIQAADHHGAAAFVRAGLGVCIMPRMAAQAAAADIDASAIVAPTPLRQIVIHTHESVAHNPIANLLVEQIAHALSNEKTPALD